LIAQEIKKKIYNRTGKLTASAGVSFNKFIAKVASDINKPDGITVITPEMADEFIDRLPIRKFFGVGKVTEEKMLNLGIKTGADLKKYKKEQLIQIFGKSGNYFMTLPMDWTKDRWNPTGLENLLARRQPFQRTLMIQIRCWRYWKISLKD